MPRSDGPKPAPHGNGHEPHERRWILMPKVLVIKPHHALVLVPFHEERAVSAADALVVEYRGVGHKPDLPLLLPIPHADVEVFTVQEVSLVERADILDRLPLEQHAGTGDRLDIDRLGRPRLKMQIEIVEEFRESLRHLRKSSRKPRESADAHKRSPGRGDGAASAALLGAVGAGHVSSHHAGARIFLEHVQHSLQGTGGCDAIGIEQEHFRLGAFADAEVAAVGEAAVDWRPHHLEPRVSFEAGDDWFEALRVGGVIDDHHLPRLW